MVTREVAADLEGIRRALQEARAERPSRASSLKDIVSALTTEIDDLLRARWTYKEITETLVSRGVEISMGTLQQYHREAKRNSEGASTRKGRSTMTERTAPKVATKVDVPPVKVAEPKPEPKSKATPNAANAVPTQRRVNDDA